MSDTLDVQTAAEYLLHELGAAGGPWLAPGSFYELLVQAGLRADPENVKLIRRSFPAVGTVLVGWRSHGEAWLREAAALDGAGQARVDLGLARAAIEEIMTCCRRSVGSWNLSTRDQVGLGEHCSRIIQILEDADAGS